MTDFRHHPQRLSARGRSTAGPSRSPPRCWRSSARHSAAYSRLRRTGVCRQASPPSRRPRRSPKRRSTCSTAWSGRQMRCSAPGWPASSPASKLVTGQAQPAAPARPAEPITIVYASESGNCEKLANDLAKAARKNGLKPTLIDMADLESGRAHASEAAGIHRRHLGRGRAAGARRARLWRIDGRGRPASRRRRIRRAGARRHGLCGILRHRQEDRRTAGRARAASAWSIASIAISISPRLRRPGSATR